MIKSETTYRHECDRCEAQTSNDSYASGMNGLEEWVLLEMRTAGRERGEVYLCPECAESLATWLKAVVPVWQGEGS